MHQRCKYFRLVNMQRGWRVERSDEHNNEMDGLPMRCHYAIGDEAKDRRRRTV